MWVNVVANFIPVYNVNTGFPCFKETTKMNAHPRFKADMSFVTPMFNFRFQNIITSFN